MHGQDERPEGLFSYVRLEGRVPANHLLRVIRVLTDEVSAKPDERFEGLYSRTGRPSLAHVLMENLNGLAVDAVLTQATSATERKAALTLLGRRPGRRRITMGADKAHDGRSRSFRIRNIEETIVAETACEISNYPNEISPFPPRTEPAACGDLPSSVRGDPA
jgi:hypothetical protein